jgi:hypothetical protein
MVCFRRIAPHTFKYSGASLCCGSTTLLCTVWRAFLLKHTIAPISNDVAPAPWRKNDAALYPALTYFSAYTQYTAGLWIRIDSIRIRILIQKFRLIQKQIRTWIHKVSESRPKKSLNPDKIQIRIRIWIHNPGIQYNQKIWNLYIYDAALMRLRLQQGKWCGSCIGSGSATIGFVVEIVHRWNYVVHRSK